MLKKQGFLGKGSRVRYTHFYKILDSEDTLFIERLKLALQKLQGDAGDIGLSTPRDTSEQTGVYNWFIFSKYLSLIAMVALFFSGVGSAYLFYGYVNRYLRSMAVLLCLGAKRSSTYLVLLFQLVMLGGLASIASIVFSLVLLPALPATLSGILPTDFNQSLDWKSCVLAFGIGTVGSLFFCLPTLTKVSQLKPLVLFQDSNIAVSSSKSLQWLGFLPLLFAFWGLAWLQTQSFEEGSFFIGMFIVVIALVGGLGWVLFQSCKLIAPKVPIIGKIALRNLYRNQWTALACFLSIALGSFLVNLIPQIQRGLQEEVQRPDGLTIPSFFLFDIQPEQVEPIKLAVQEKGSKLTNLSAMVQSRIITINQVPIIDHIQRHTNSEDKSFVNSIRKRGFNLSYRDQLDLSEEIIEGKAIQSVYDFEKNEVAEISVEQRFARRYGVKLGDLLKFDIQGVEIEAKIVNLRKVRWNSFQPNFFYFVSKRSVGGCSSNVFSFHPQNCQLSKL